ncbi:hypothetical protein [Amycolatopsis taiwanensis]|uniref:DUF308 domain-containing protein n=1 Tax=Amycolatopsis taiwanensis TaxID=342230 RepID=A0A9W6R5Y2_9PSEU|nr:hypothetical protein [Amycolatopsis taiwanensis]GLY69858.1 hypothetical protein Atai01_64770 [Amycolatopsis taiwanensis]
MSSRDTDPEDVDATFAAIVADLEAEGVGKFEEEEKPGEPAERPRPGNGEEAWRTGGTSWEQTVLGDDPAEDNEHYVPPEPPPLPRPGKGAFVVLLLLVVGLFVLIAPGVIGLGSNVGTPLGILALAAAIALALLRVKQGPHDGDGAQV